jgi:hypothetical protein
MHSLHRKDLGRLVLAKTWSGSGSVIQKADVSDSALEAKAIFFT